MKLNKILKKFKFKVYFEKLNMSSRVIKSNIKKFGDSGKKVNLFIYMSKVKVLR